MEIDSDVTFIDVIRNDLVRKELLSYLPTLDDCTNLATTCRYINFLIYNDKIKKKLLRYFDEQNIYITGHGDCKDSDENNIDNVEFNVVGKLNKELVESQNYTGETCIFKNQINFKIKNSLIDVNIYNSKLFGEKFIKECQFNSRVRKEATNIELKFEDFLSNRNNHNLVLYIISCMSHPNIESIKMPDTAFMSHPKTYNNLKSNIFGGFPKFNELIICAPRFKNGFRRFMENIDILKNILKELSERDGATLILECHSDEWSVFVNLAHMVRILSLNQNIKIKCDVGHIIPLIEIRRDLVCPPSRCVLFPIEDLVSSFINYIDSYSMLTCILRNLQYFKNLEKIDLRLSLFNIDKEVKNIHKIDINNLSLKDCNKLKTIRIEFSEDFDKNDISIIKIINNNLEIFFSLMPDSVERLDLKNVPEMSSNLVKVIDKNMPNIKIFVTYDVTFKDINCLNILKDLKCLVLYQNVPVNIPMSVEVFGVGCGNCFEKTKKHDCKEEKIRKEMKKKDCEKVLEDYLSRFSVRVQCSEDKFIYFNDVRRWKEYKRFFQKNFNFF